MNKTKLVRCVFIGSTITLMLTGSFMRILLWRVPLSEELLRRAGSIVLSVGLFNLWKRFRIADALKESPVQTVAFLYLIGFWFLLGDKLQPTSNGIISYYGAIPFALSVAAILYSLRITAGYRGLVVAVLAPIPAYIALAYCRSIAGALILACIHFILVITAWVRQWFDCDCSIALQLIFLAAMIGLAIWVFFYDGDIRCIHAVENLLNPKVGSWDYMIRSGLMNSEWISVPVADSSLFGQIGTPYLLAQMRLTLGRWDALSLMLLLFLYGISGICLVTTKPCFWAIASGCAIAVPIMLYLLQNYGFHIAYVNLPILDSGVVSTALTLWAGMVIEGERPDGICNS